VRTYEDIYRDFCAWLVLKTQNIELSYNSLVSNIDKDVVHSFLYKSILELCYDKDHGMYYFCKFIIGDLLHIGFPKPFRFNTLFKKWYELVKKHKKLSIQAARGHGKSAFFDQLLNLYEMFLSKYRRVIIISSSQEQANSRLEELKIIIEGNEWLISKRNLKKWATETIGYNNGYILVKGIESELLGQHVDRIIMDDILRQDTKISDKDIEDRIDMSLDPMLLARNGQMILAGTPKRASDIFAEIENRKKENPKCPWRIEKFPAILDYERKILQCPDRFTWEALMNKRLSMGPLKFAREYQLNFFSRDASLFPKSLIDSAISRGKDRILSYKADKKTPNWIYVIGVDTARSGSVSADYTVVTVLAYDCVTQAKEIAYAWRGKGLKISEQARKIFEISKNFGSPMIMVEQNNMGQDMIDELVDNYNCFVEAYQVGGSKKKEELVRFLVNAFEHEQISIPYGNAETRELMDVLIDELGKFCVTITPAGNERYQGVSSHDDFVSSLSLANRATQTAGVPFAVTKSGSAFQQSGDIYGSLLGQSSMEESDIVKKIKMGLIR